MSSIAGETTVIVRARVDQAQAKADIEKGLTGATQSVGDIQKQLTVKLDIQDAQKQIKQLEGTFGTLLQASRLPSVAGNPAQFAQVQKELASVAAEIQVAKQRYDSLTLSVRENTAATVQNAEASKLASPQRFATGFRSNLLNVARDAQQGAGLGELASFAGKAGLIGLGINTVFQATQHLGDALRVTGQEANTSVGRLRNVGAALTSGDVIGAISAATKETLSLSSAQAAVAESSPQMQEALISLFGEAKVGIQIIGDLNAQVEDLATGTGTLATALKGVDPTNLTAIASRISALAPGFDTTKLAEEAQKQLLAARTPLPTQVPQFLQTQLAQAQLGGNQGQIKARLQQQDQALQREIEEVRSASGFTQEETNKALESLFAGRKAIADQIAGIDSGLKRAREDRLAAQAAILQATVQTTLTQNDITQAEARSTRSEIAALQERSRILQGFAADKHFTDQQRLDFQLQAAQIDKQVFGIQQQIAATAAANAKEEARLAEEEKERNAAKLKRQQDAAQQLVELKLQNGVAKAQLTEGTANDRKAIQAQIDYYREVVSSTTGLEREQARSKLIAARGQLKQLSGNESNSGGGATLSDIFGAAVANFSAFGSNIAGRNGVLSGQDERASFAQEFLKRNGGTASVSGALIGLGGTGNRASLDTVVAEQRASADAQVSEQRVTNTLLRRIVQATRPDQPRVPKTTPEYTIGQAASIGRHVRGA